MRVEIQWMMRAVLGNQSFQEAFLLCQNKTADGYRNIMEGLFLHLYIEEVDLEQGLTNFL